MPRCLGASGSVRTGGVGIGADRKPDEVGLVPAGGPQLLAVDDVVVPVAPRGGPQRGQIRAGVGFGVADREVHVAGQDPREEQFLLSRTAETDQRRADRLQGDRGQMYVGVLRLVGEDRLLDLAEAVAAVLARPADAHPAVLAQLADDPLVALAVPVAGQLLLVVPAGKGREVAADLLLEPALVIAELEVLGGGVLDADRLGSYVERASARTSSA